MDFEDDPGAHCWGYEFSLKIEVVGE